MTNRFTNRAQNALNAALRAASLLGHTYIGSEHLLLGLMSEEDSIAGKLLLARGADAARIRSVIVDLAGEGIPGSVSPADMTPRTQRILQVSAHESAVGGQSYIGTEHLLFALLSEEDCVAVRILDTLGVSIEELRRDVTQFTGFSGDSDALFDGRGAGNHERSSSKERERSVGRPRKSDDSLHGAPVLSQYGRDLTAQARAGRLDPIIGREEETDRVIRILSRRTKNNPCLIGEPGVGKTAVVEGLAQRIVEGNVPETVRDKTVVTLDLAAMIAGAKYRGEFEERFKNVMAEAKKDPRIILFIDELHTIVGAGAAEGAVDAANIIKPALARGELQVIGATTVSEYRKHVEKDAALERRFQAVTVGEPSEEEALRILTGLRAKYEAHHKVKISDQALSAAVSLSARYIPDRHLPDKAIDLIDEAASRLRISAYTSPPDLKAMESRLAATKREKEEAVKEQSFERAARLRDEETRQKQAYDAAQAEWAQRKDTGAMVLDASAIADVVTQWTGIPVSRLLEGEGERLLRLEDTLRARVIGQDPAIEAVARAVRRGRMGLKDPHRPIGSFIFLGPTGVGKTQLSKALAEAVFGDENALIRLDMSEYMEKHSISRMIGSPPGYVGHEEGGQLTEKIRRRPYAALLFDEIEKAHPDVFNLLLQALDDGILTDAQGRRVDLRHTIIIMTSNLGAAHKERNALGFVGGSLADSDDREARERMMTALKDTFRPEFINRVDDIIIFNRLGREEIGQIAALMLEEVKVRAAALDIALSFDPAVVSLIGDAGFDPIYGARPLRRAVVRLIEDPLSTALLEGTVKVGDAVQVTVSDGKAVFNAQKH